MDGGGGGRPGGTEKGGAYRPPPPPSSGSSSLSSPEDASLTGVSAPLLAAPAASPSSGATGLLWGLANFKPGCTLGRVVKKIQSKRSEISHSNTAGEQVNKGQDGRTHPRAHHQVRMSANGEVDGKRLCT